MISELAAVPSFQPGSVRKHVRKHVGFMTVLVGALVLRVAVELAYRPALFFADSWRYLSMAFHGWPVGILPSRPSGYPLLLRLLGVRGDGVLLTTVVQHASGLAIGALLYAVLLKLGVRRLIAVAAAAVVMFDSYAVALEQFIMADTFFSLLAVGALAITILRRDRPWALVLAGGMLAAACTVRTTGLFVVPVWVIFVLWTARDRRRLACAIAGLLVPLFVYLGWHAINTGGSVGFDQAGGWFLYGRIAQIADCDGVRVPRPTEWLCDVPPPLRRTLSPGGSIWDVGAPAVWLFGGDPDTHAGSPGGQAITVHDNRLLEEFAVAIIRHRPLAYVDLVASDFARFFDPTASPAADADGVTVTFPSAPLTAWLWTGPRNRYLPGYVPRVRGPAPVLEAYQQVVHAPRLLLGALSILAAIAWLAPVLSPRRAQIAHRPEIFLLSASGLAMLLGSAAFAAFVVRYLVPSVPLLMGGGLIATAELWRATTGWRELAPAFTPFARLSARRAAGAGTARRSRGCPAPR